MFIELECCEKCFMHKQSNHNEWTFHENFCKLDETVSRKCKLRTLKNIKLSQKIMQELESYDFSETEIVGKIIDQEKEKIKPEIESFEIKYKGIYVFSLHETRNFPDYNLVARILLTLKKAYFNELSLLNMEIQNCNFVSLYEFVKHKYHNSNEKNIKFKSINQLIPQKDFRRTKVSTSKSKPIFQDSITSKNRQSNTEITQNQPTSFQDSIFKERSQNIYIFKKKNESNPLNKPQTSDNRKSLRRRSQKKGGRGSANMSLPKISKQDDAAKKRHLKRIRYKKFSNRYSSINKKSDIFNKLVRSEYGRIKEEKYEFLSKESDIKVNSGFEEDFYLQQLSQNSQEEENIFRNCPSFTKMSCIELLNELCKPDEPLKKYSDPEQNNLPQIESTKLIRQSFEQNQFTYEKHYNEQMPEFDQFETNINSMKSRIQFSQNKLEPIKETEEEKLENFSCNSSVVQNKKPGFFSTNKGAVREKQPGKITIKRMTQNEQLETHPQSQKLQQILPKLQVIEIDEESLHINNEQKEVSAQQLEERNEINLTKNQLPLEKKNQQKSRSVENIQQSQSQSLKPNGEPLLDILDSKSFQNNGLINHNIELESRSRRTKENDKPQNHSIQEVYPWEQSEQKNPNIQKMKKDNHIHRNIQKKPNFASEICSQGKFNENYLISDQKGSYSTQYSLFAEYFLSNLPNFAQKVSAFKSYKSTHNRCKDFSKVQKVQEFFNFVYPCPRILLETKNKKKIAKIIENFINQYLEQMQQNEKEWLQLSQTNVCNIFLLSGSELPKKVKTILWNRSNSMKTKLYITKPQEEFQSFIQLGQLQKEYREILFLFYDKNFELYKQTFKINEISSSENQRALKKFRKFKFDLKIGEKYFLQSEEAKNESNHIFIAFEAKSHHNENIQTSPQIAQKLKRLNLDPENELEVKIQVYQNLKDGFHQSEGEGLIGTIERKGKFFFELNLQKGQYKFEITTSNADFTEEFKKKDVELLFFSEAEVNTSQIKEAFQ